MSGIYLTDREAGEGGGNVGGNGDQWLSTIVVYYPPDTGCALVGLGFY